VAEQVEAVVIGAGQAGLAISYYLTQQRRPHVVLEQAEHIVPAWREGRWDSFTLVIPNWSVQLPGFPYQGDEPDGFMTCAEIVDHLERYAESFRAPVRCGVAYLQKAASPILQRTSSSRPARSSSRSPAHCVRTCRRRSGSSIPASTGIRAPLLLERCW